MKLPSGIRSIPSTLLIGAIALACTAFSVSAADSRKKSTTSKSKQSTAQKEQKTQKSVEDISEFAKESLVVIHYVGRSGSVEGMGTGFVVDSKGLIATSLHVIGEGRPIRIQMTNGKQYQATRIHAWDRKLDLAVIEVEADKLKPLALGDSDELKQGASIVAIGNPHGLRYSVVQGVVSAKRDIEGTEMIQLAIPVEPGNSGGPLLDMDGHVRGILTMKSATTPNIGFAMPVNALKLLLEKPNPVPIDRWQNIGALNPEEWKPLFGAMWTQKADRILVEGAGTGFGGRSFCVAQNASPKLPYEIAVSVKLDNETGAAGLIFASDGGDKCYGFYPSGGRLRLTRFEGANVFTWQVLKEIETPHYRDGEWNYLKVRYEGDNISCYVNDQVVARIQDEPLAGTLVGLAKFRETKAEFRDFRVAASVPNKFPSPELSTNLLSIVERSRNARAGDDQFIETLPGESRGKQLVLLEKAKELEREAARLRSLASRVHHLQVRDDLAKLFSAPDDKVDLFHAALLVSKLDNAELNVDAYLRDLDRHAREIASRIPKRADDTARIKAVSDYLFRDNGFHGSRSDYYNRANSYVNDVLDDREGIPITLSVVYIELARRSGVSNLFGLGLPGHFLVQYVPADGKRQVIDVFEGGGLLKDVDADALIRSWAGRPLTDEEMRPATKREIIVRMLRNLVGVSMRAGLVENPMHYLDTILAIDPSAGMERWSRAMLRLRAGDDSGGKQDLEWLLDNSPPGVDLQRVEETYRSLRREPQRR